MRWTLAFALAASAASAQDATYENPLRVTSEVGAVTSCADPSAEPAGGAGAWVMACTTDPLNAEDRDANGDLVFHLVPLFRSDDLVTWEHAGDAFDRDPATPTPDPPEWAASDAVLWAPEVARIGDRWALLFAVTDVADAFAEEFGGEPGCDEDSAVGMAWSDSPWGPWEATDAPLVEPRRAGEGCEFLWTLDPEALETAEGGYVLYYGSFYAGIEARELVVAPDGTITAPGETAVPITIGSRYEGAEVVLHDGRYTLMASATNCCAGPQTGYAVFAGQSESPFGPFLDREGVSLLDPRVGGTPVIVQNGNAWVGPGHNTVLQDEAGAWWTLYHAVEEAEPYFEGEPGFTRRPVLLDALTWEDGWPVVAGGPSEGPRPAPVAGGFAEDFEGALDPAWSWDREPEGVEVAGGVLRWPTEAGELFEDSNDAGVLWLPAPQGDYAWEARVRTDVPDEGEHNYVQAGLVVRDGDDAYLKLVVASIWETRQTEFGRELPRPPEGAPRYGNTVVGPVGADWTWLRIEVRRGETGETYVPFTSRDGEVWTEGGAWTHSLGDAATVGLVAMSGAGFTAEFDDVRLRPLD